MSSAILFWMTVGINGIGHGNPMGYKEKVQLHFYLIVWSTLLAVGGFVAIYLNKESRNKPHFYTYHGQFGLIGEARTDGGGS